jgi:hypothetical protein
VNQDKPPANAAGQSKDRSVLKPKPAGEAIKPKDYAIETFALASVIAHEYPHKRWVQLLAYSYAGGVVGARLAANKHFPADVMAGGAMGWFVGAMFMANATTRISTKSPPSRRGFSITFASAARTPRGRLINTGGFKRYCFSSGIISRITSRTLAAHLREEICAVSTCAQSHLPSKRN